MTTTQKTDDQTSILEGNGTTPATAKKNSGIEPLRFIARRDVRIVEMALQRYKGELANLAKKNSAEGYTDESRQMVSDAEGIEYRILPQLRAQRELPLVSYEALEKELTNHLSGTVRAGFTGLEDLKTPPTKAAIKSRSDSLLRRLASQLAHYARDVAQGSFDEGYARSTLTAEGLALKHVARLGGRDD